MCIRDSAYTAKHGLLNSRGNAQAFSDDSSYYLLCSLEILTVDGHVKKGAYVPSHLHLNVTYLLEAEEGEGLHIKEDENSGVAWFLPGDAVLASTEPWMRERVYRKLNEKINRNERINL